MSSVVSFVQFPSFSLFRVTTPMPRTPHDCYIVSQLGDSRSRFGTRRSVAQVLSPDWKMAAISAATGALLTSASWR